MVDYRNYLAHQCFKEKLLNNKLETLDDIDLFVNELNEYEVTVAELNEFVLEIFKKHKIKTIFVKP